MSREAVSKFRDAINASEDLQDQIRSGADLMAMGKENGFEFTAEELGATLNDLGDELSDFELEVVSGGTQFNAFGKPVTGSDSGK